MAEKKEMAAKMRKRKGGGGGDDEGSSGDGRGGKRFKKVASSGGSSGGGGERAGKWKQNFALLQKYKEEVGTPNVPITHEVEVRGETVKLGRWLRSVQNAWASNKLPDEKAAALKGLGLTTEAEVATDAEGRSAKDLKEPKHSFYEFADALTTFKAEKGSLAISRDYVSPSGLRSGE